MQRPVALQPLLAPGIDTQVVARLELADAAQHGTRRGYHRVQREQQVQGLGIQLGIHAAGRQQGLCVGGEADAPADAGQIQRLDAHAVAAQQQALGAPVIQGEREHAVQPRHDPLAPLRVAAQDHLGIAAGEETMATAFQFATQRAEVVDRAIENQRQPGLRIEHRLVRALREIQDRQPAVPQGHTPGGPQPIGVRPAAFQAGQHARDGLATRASLAPDEFSCDPAHRFVPCGFVLGPVSPPLSRARRGFACGHAPTRPGQADGGARKVCSSVPIRAWLAAPARSRSAWAM